MKKFSDVYRFMVPSWLLEGDGDAVLGSLSTLVDATVSRVREGLLARFPTSAGASALRLIGQDRGIPRGRSETATHYAARVKRWRWPRGHRIRGGAFALLEQVSEYFGGILCLTIDVNGNQFMREPNGAETATHLVPWNWDGPTSILRRFWLVLYPNPEVPTIKPWPAWGTTLPWGGRFATAADGDAAVTLGQQGVTAGDVRALQRLFVPPHAWKPAGTNTDWAVVVLEDHTGPTTPVDPAGQWGTLRGIATTAPATFRFWKVH